MFQIMKVNETEILRNHLFTTWCLHIPCKVLKWILQLPLHCRALPKSRFNKNFSPILSCIPPLCHDTVIRKRFTIEFAKVCITYLARFRVCCAQHFTGNMLSVISLLASPFDTRLSHEVSAEQLCLPRCVHRQWDGALPRRLHRLGN